MPCTLAASTRFEAQRRAAPHEFGGTTAVTQRVGPVEAVAQRSETPFCRQIGEVADLEQGILQVRGDHGEVVGIQRNELQLGHWQRASLIERRSDSEAVASLQHIRSSFSK